MKMRFRILLLFVIGLGLMTTSSCKTGEGCKADDYYRSSTSPEHFKKSKRSKSTLFSKKHRKRMAKKRSSS